MKLYDLLTKYVAEITAVSSTNRITFTYRMHTYRIIPGDTPTSLRYVSDGFDGYRREGEPMMDYLRSLSVLLQEHDFRYVMVGRISGSKGFLRKPAGIHIECVPRS